MAFELVSKRDLSSSASLGCEEEQAVRHVAAGAEDEALHALVLAVMKRARRDGLWLGCDCRSEDGRRPVVAPCRNHRGTDYWRVRAGQRRRISSSFDLRHGRGAPPNGGCCRSLALTGNLTRSIGMCAA